jgi:hypothetical protein
MLRIYIIFSARVTCQIYFKSVLPYSPHKVLLFLEYNFLEQKVFQEYIVLWQKCLYLWTLDTNKQI